jgi:nucleotide-binding universal stress UspA family protein
VTGREETAMSTWKTVLVGVDGSPPSRKALSWAAAEAAEHQAQLTVLSVLEPGLIPPTGNPSVGHTPVRTTESAAADLVALIREVLGDDPPMVVQPRVVQGNPAHVLIENSEGADLLVVGTRGHGGFAGLILGSVSQHVAAYAKCAVTVVR